MNIMLIRVLVCEYIQTKDNLLDNLSMEIYILLCSMAIGNQQSLIFVGHF